MSIRKIFKYIVGNKPPASLIVEQLDWNASKDLTEKELQPMLDVMAKMPELARAVTDAREMIKEVRSLGFTGG